MNESRRFPMPQNITVPFWRFPRPSAFGQMSRNGNNVKWLTWVQQGAQRMSLSSGRSWLDQYDLKFSAAARVPVPQIGGPARSKSTRCILNRFSQSQSAETPVVFGSERSERARRFYSRECVFCLFFPSLYAHTVNTRKSDPIFKHIVPTFK